MPEPIYDTDADIEFSDIDPLNWRELEEPEDINEDDDEPIDTFPPDVVDALGFDRSDLFVGE